MGPLRLLVRDKLLLFRSIRSRRSYVHSCAGRLVLVVLDG
jgi:hypothetical protein